MTQTNWKNYLVKIIVPGSQGEDYIATGYPFKENHLLTAWHAINKPDIDHEREWRFIWLRFDSETEKPEINIKTPKIINSASNLDWAVIHFDFNSHLYYRLRFSERIPQEDETIHIGGYPKSRHSNDNPYFDFKGTALSNAGGEAEFLMNVGADVENPKNLGGFSGAPVINKVGVVFGIFVDISSGESCNTFRVLSAESILKDKNFNCLLTPEQKSPRYAAIKNVIESTQCEAPQLFECLYNAFDIADQNIENLAAKIYSQSTQESLTAIHRYVRDSMNNHPVNLESIIDFCNLLLPKLVTPHDQQTIEQSLERQSGNVWFEHSASTYEEVESHMAHYDDRPASYEPAGSDQLFEELRGKNAMTFPEAAAGEINPQTKLIETESGFYSTFAAPQTRRVQFPRLLQDQQQKMEAVKALQQSAADNLKFESKESGQTRYYVSNNDGNDALIEKLSAKCPYFLLLKLDEDQDNISNEVNRYRPLQALYKKTKQN